MNLSSDEAARALADIDAAGTRSARLQRYRHFAPHLMLWGGIWLLANTVTDLWPVRAALAWPCLSLAGAAASFWLGARRRGRDAVANAAGTGALAAGVAADGWRWGLSFAAIIAFQIATMVIVQPQNGRQQNAFISLFWTFLYTVLGVWLGWRLFAIGFAASVLIVAGYFLLAAHFFLYMGVVAGGALIAGGLLLRRA
jgi:hypothetical protein